MQVSESVDLYMCAFHLNLYRLYVEILFLFYLADIVSEWVLYDDRSVSTGRGSIACTLDQYLSGLSYTLSEDNASFISWGRCSTLPPGYSLKESHCWTSERTLVQGSNGTVALQSSQVVPQRIEIEYLGILWFLPNLYFWTRWSYVFCEIVDGTVLTARYYSFE